MSHDKENLTEGLELFYECETTKSDKDSTLDFQMSAQMSAQQHSRCISWLSCSEEMEKVIQLVLNRCWGKV